MPTKEKQSSLWFLVVEALPKCLEYGNTLTDSILVQSCLKDLAQNYHAFFWATLHDSDLDENGELERPHWHIALDLRTRHTKQGIINILARCLSVAKERVSVRECRSLTRSIRYLMHMDNPEKTPYLPSDVITNDKSGLIQAMSCSSDDLNFTDLITAIKASKSPVELINRIGLRNYQRYRSTILDLLSYFKG